MPKEPAQMKIDRRIAWMLSLLVFTSVSCKKDKDDEVVPIALVNEEEVITTVILKFTHNSGGVDRELRFADVDGAGGNAPVYLIDSLDASASYTVETILLNETTTPVDTISNEVQEEGTAHQFFYTVSGVDLSVAYGDTDADGRPIGLLTTMSSGTPGSGTLLVTLRHEPDKSAAGVAAGDITNAGGETDVEVSFPLVVRE